MMHSIYYDWTGREDVQRQRLYEGQLASIGCADAVESANSVIRARGMGSGGAAAAHTEDDIDLHFPLDLMVSNADPIPGGTYRRTRSPEVITKFGQCFEKVLETLSSTQEK